MTEKTTEEYTQQERPESSGHAAGSRTFTPGQIERLKHQYIAIVVGEIKLHAVRNPDFPKDSDDEIRAFLYTDPNGVGDILDQCRELIRWYLQEGEYRAGDEKGTHLIRSYAYTDIKNHFH